jgi:hypothetical protein
MIEMQCVSLLYVFWAVVHSSCRCCHAIVVEFERARVQGPDLVIEVLLPDAIWSPPI